MVKAIKDASWEVFIFNNEQQSYYWQARTIEKIMIFDNRIKQNGFSSGKHNAIKNFIKFAKLNNITNYEITNA